MQPASAQFLVLVVSALFQISTAGDCFGFNYDSSSCNNKCKSGQVCEYSSFFGCYNCQAKPGPVETFLTVVVPVIMVLIFLAFVITMCVCCCVPACALAKWRSARSTRGAVLIPHPQATNSTYPAGAQIVTGYTSQPYPYGYNPVPTNVTYSYQPPNQPPPQPLPLAYPSNSQPPPPYGFTNNEKR